MRGSKHSTSFVFVSPSIKPSTKVIGASESNILSHLCVGGYCPFVHLELRVTFSEKHVYISLYKTALSYLIKLRGI